LTPENNSKDACHSPDHKHTRKETKGLSFFTNHWKQLIIADGKLLVLGVVEIFFLWKKKEKGIIGIMKLLTE